METFGIINVRNAFLSILSDWLTKITRIRRLDVGMISDCLKIVVTSSVALTAGLLCDSIGAPAPYLMGSLFGVWVVGGVLPVMQRYLGIARWFYIPVAVSYTHLTLPTKRIV